MSDRIRSQIAGARKYKLALWSSPSSCGRTTRCTEYSLPAHERKGETETEISEDKKVERIFSVGHH